MDTNNSDISDRDRKQVIATIKTSTLETATIKMTTLVIAAIHIILTATITVVSIYTAKIMTATFYNKNSDNKKCYSNYRDRTKSDNKTIATATIVYFLKECIQDDILQQVKSTFFPKTRNCPTF